MCLCNDVYVFFVYLNNLWVLNMLILILFKKKCEWILEYGLIIVIFLGCLFIDGNSVIKFISYVN